MACTPYHREVAIVHGRDRVHLPGYGRRAYTTLCSPPMVPEGYSPPSLSFSPSLPGVPLSCSGCLSPAVLGVSLASRDLSLRLSLASRDLSLRLFPEYQQEINSFNSFVRNRP